MSARKSKASKARRPENTQVTISISKDLLRYIDKAASRENRNRSNWIATRLQEAVGGYDSPPGPAMGEQ